MGHEEGCVFPYWDIALFFWLLVDIFYVYAAILSFVFEPRSQKPDTSRGGRHIRDGDLEDKGTAYQLF